jgi:hypothetical protein
MNGDRAMTVTDDRRRAKLRGIAEAHGWELAGLSAALWPRSRVRLETLRAAWEVVEPDARAGVLTGELDACNYRGGRRPLAFYLWTRPDLDRPDDGSEAAVLHAAGELSPVEIATLGVMS